MKSCLISFKWCDTYTPIVSIIQAIGHLSDILFHFILCYLRNPEHSYTQLHVCVKAYNFAKYIIILTVGFCEPYSFIKYYITVCCEICTAAKYILFCSVLYTVHIKFAHPRLLADRRFIMRMAKKYIRFVLRQISIMAELRILFGSIENKQKIFFAGRTYTK